MIARSFKSVIWVATVGGAALSCYMVSLRVATERADLAKVEHQILVAKRDIRMLQTELGTRGRMSQLEDWNSNVLALAAPTSAQFVHDDMTLARLERHDATVEERTSGDVRMASAETGAAAATAQPAAPAAEAPKPHIVTAIAHAAPPPPPSVVHQASYTTAPKSPLGPELKKAEPKKVEPKPERHAKAAPAKAPAAKPAPEKKLAAKAAPEKKAAAKPAPEKKLAAKAKPAAEKKAPEKKLASRGKIARHPAAAQESDAD
ncbi:MAG TPA: hypothetical protein VGC56_12750 [Allosphingosinicella sp.]|jgi:hypothetical protein